MINHGVQLVSGNCVLRPTTEGDMSRILELWNSDNVVGSMFVSKVDESDYLRFFEKYKTDPHEWRWTIESHSGAFVGTIRVYEKSAQFYISQFALWPTKDFLAVAPIIIVNNFIFFNLQSDAIHMELARHNKRIKKLHGLLGAEYSGESIPHTACNGSIVILEHWTYKRSIWCQNITFINSLLS